MIARALISILVLREGHGRNECKASSVRSTVEPLHKKRRERALLKMQRPGFGHIDSCFPRKRIGD